MSVDTESFTILLSLSCMTSHPWVFLNASRANQCGAGRNRTKGLTSTHRTSRGDTLSVPTSHYLLTPTHTQTPHTEKLSPGASSPSPLAYTHSREWNLLSDVIFISLSRPLSFLVLSLPRPPSAPPKPRQMHQLHIHTCYITYPIDLKSPLLTFISHTTFLLNKVWPKSYFRVSTYIQHYKVIWRSMNVNLHCVVPTMIFISHCEFLYFYTI